MTELQRLKPKTQADSKTVHWIQRHSLKILILACLLVTVVPIVRSQEDDGWQVESVTFFPHVTGIPYQISAGAGYIVEGSPWLSFTSVSSSEAGYETFHYTGSLPRWLHDTMIYREYEREGWGDPPQCNDANLITFGFYDAATNTDELYCLVPPADYTIQQAEQPYDILDRYPFDEHTVLVNRRYIVDLETGIWRDLQGTVPTTVSPEATHNWMAHGEVWWDAQTGLPTAYLRSLSEGNAVVAELTNETIRLCPLESDACQPIVSVQDYVHGILGDMVISPDGQSILWTSLTYAQDEPVLAGIPAAIGAVEDAAAFVTNLQTGETTEIFRLSDYNTIPSKGVSAQWSEDGLTLAVELNSPTQNLDEDGLLLVQFSR
jgi:hypothetical protein